MKIFETSDKEFAEFAQKIFYQVLSVDLENWIIGRCFAKLDDSEI